MDDLIFLLILLVFIMIIVFVVLMFFWAKDEIWWKMNAKKIRKKRNAIVMNIVGKDRRGWKSICEIKDDKIKVGNSEYIYNPDKVWHDKYQLPNILYREGNPEAIDIYKVGDLISADKLSDMIIFANLLGQLQKPKRGDVFWLLILVSIGISVITLIILLMLMTDLGNFMNNAGLQSILSQVVK